jgi:dephospho-CoA kinase
MKIMQAQASRQERLNCANHVIENNGDYPSLLEQVETMHLRFAEMAEQKRLHASSY